MRPFRLTSQLLAHRKNISETINNYKYRYCSRDCLLRKRSRQRKEFISHNSLTTNASCIEDQRYQGSFHIIQHILVDKLHEVLEKLDCCHKHRSTMKQGSTQWMLLAATLWLVSSASAEIIPKKSWPVIGYEAFNKKKGTSKAVVKGNDASATTPTTRRSTTSDRPNSVTKAVVGVGVAAAFAAVGGKALAGEHRPERSLVEAMSKPVVAMRTTNGGAAAAPAATTTEGASIPNEVFNLVKGIVGVGVLSLPAGVAAFGSAPSAFIPAGILIAVIGVLSGYGFALIGKVCAYTGAKSYREAWSKTVGEGTSWIPAWSVTLKTFMACLAFSMVLADTFSSLLETTRNPTLLVVTGLVLLPLCLLKNLKSLAPFSLLGVMGMAYTAVAMTVRMFDGGYAMGGETEGRFIEQIASSLRPKFGNMGAESVLSPNALILVCMLSTAYMVRKLNKLMNLFYKLYCLVLNPTCIEKIVEFFFQLSDLTTSMFSLKKPTGTFQRSQVLS